MIELHELRCSGPSDCTCEPIPAYAARPFYLDELTSAGKEALRRRLMSKVEMTNTCWLWQGYTRNGYGRINVRTPSWKSHKLAYRVLYELTHGAVAPGLELDHLCRVRSCVNPDHLEPVTRLENARRGGNFNRSKTHCPQGHPYDEENTRLWTRSNGRVFRQCRICSLDSLHRRRAAKRNARMRLISEEAS